MAEETSTRKKVIIGVIVAIVLIGPLVALSGWGMGKMEAKAISGAPEPWAADMQLRLASTYGLTLRRGKQRAAFEKFLKHFPNHPRRGYAKYMIAVCMERDHDCSRVQAAETYKEFLWEYAEDPQFQTNPDWRELVEEAERAVRRLGYN
ncbi:MAG: hypothetical protein ACYTGB_19415 [Planctomycetota bacterium]|jgi:hypothetical protein